jgi:maltose O-acetyltransferase
MKRYGFVRPLAMTAVAFATSGFRIMRSAYQQSRLQVGENVRIAHDVSIVGRGEIVLGDGVVVCQGVVLRSEEGAIIEIGPGSRIGANSSLEVKEGGALRLGSSSTIGPRCHIIDEHGIFWGEHSSLGGDSFIGPREPGGVGKLIVGQQCHLHQHTFIDLCADVILGDHVRAGPLCSFYTHNHQPQVGKLVWQQDPTFAPINIGVGTWIGHACCVLPGVSIGHNSTVAAGAVVTKSIDPWTVTGGVPARVLRTLGKEAFA